MEHPSCFVCFLSPLTAYHGGEPRASQTPCLPISQPLMRLYRAHLSPRLGRETQTFRTSQPCIWSWG